MGQDKPNTNPCQSNSKDYGENPSVHWSEFSINHPIHLNIIWEEH